MPGNIKTKIMKYYIIFLLLLLTACSKKPIYTSNRVEGPAVIDGIFKEWSVPMNYDEKSKMEYGIGNDEKYLYVNLKITDKVLTNKIFMTGLTLWIDTVGKNKKMYGIKYPIGQGRKRDNREITRERIPGEIRRPVRPDLQRKHEVMEIIGFTKKGARELADPEGTPGMHFSVSRDQLGVFYYKARILLDKIITDVGPYLTDTTRLLSIGFETGHIDMPNMTGRSPGMRSGGGSRMPGGRTGGSGRTGGGSRPGGRTMDPSQRMDSMKAMSQSTKLRIPKVRLTD